MARSLARMFFLAALLAGGLTGPAPARADIPSNSLPPVCRGVIPTQPLRWIAVWNFDGNSTGCILYTGTPAAPGQLPPITSYQLVPCTTTGTIPYDDSYALFNGSSYLSCQFKPQQDAVGPTYAQYADFWMYAYVKFPPIAGTYPLFYHQNASLSATRQVTNDTYVNWKFQHTDGSISTGTSPGYVSSDYNALKVAQRCAPGALCDNPAEAAYVQSPYLNGKATATQEAQAPIRFNVGMSTIHIGYSPVTQQRLRGYLGKLVIDPTQVGRDPIGD